jgi:hypothetical protein
MHVLLIAAAILLAIHFAFAKATGAQVVKTAKAVRDQYGSQNECDVVGKLADANKKDGIRTAHSAFRKAGLALQVKVTELESPCDNMFVMYLSDMVKFMADHNELHRFLGGHAVSEIDPILRRFWDNFRRIHPDNEVFEMIDLGRADPGCLVPFIVHGDEGRGNRSTYIYIYIYIHIYIDACIKMCPPRFVSGSGLPWTFPWPPSHSIRL